MAFQESLPKPRPRLKSRAFPTTAFGKLFLKRFGRIILRFAVFWPTLSRRFRKVCQSLPRPRLKSRAFPTTAFGKLFFKAFRTYHSSFCRVLANTFVAFQESLPKPRPRLKSRAFPTTAFGKLFLKRFGRIILRFAVFWPTLSWRFSKVCQRLGRVSKAAHSLPLHSENFC